MGPSRGEVPSSILILRLYGLCSGSFLERESLNTSAKLWYSAGTSVISGGAMEPAIPLMLGAAGWRVYC